MRCARNAISARRDETVGEPLGQLGAVQIAADEDHAIGAVLVGLPGPVRFTVEQHVDSLKHEAPILACDRDDALHPEDVDALLAE